MNREMNPLAYQMINRLGLFLLVLWYHPAIFSKFNLGFLAAMYHWTSKESNKRSWPHQHKKRREGKDYHPRKQQQQHNSIDQMTTRCYKNIL